MKNTPLVEMVNIHKWFGRVYALKGVDFRVNHNEIVGLVGDNGAGKSTLIKILSGLFPPDRGEIYFEGQRIKFNSPRDAINIGIETIHQETAVVNTMEVMRNIFMGREPVKRIGPIRWLDMKRMEIGAVEALKKVGLSLRSPKAIVEELSGGQRQGVAIGRAMYFNAKLLILDEPTNNLSVKESNRVLQFVRDIKDRGISSIFITHNLHYVYPVADRIVILSHGEKVGDIKKDKTTVEELTEIIISGTTILNTTKS